MYVSPGDQHYVRTPFSSTLLLVIPTYVPGSARRSNRVVMKRQIQDLKMGVNLYQTSRLEVMLGNIYSYASLPLLSLILVGTRGY